MAFQLVPEADERQTVSLDKAIIFFGRHPECDVVITSSRKVSRKHCCIAQVDNQLVVRDLGSMNGVRVNGKTIRHQSPLRPGDSLIVGDVVFHLKEAPLKRKNNPPRRKSEKQKQSRMPRDLSQDIPVVIPEEDESFSVEESIRRRPADYPASNEAIVLSDADILDEDDDDSEVEFPVLE